MKYLKKKKLKRRIAVENLLPQRTLVKNLQVHLDPSDAKKTLKICSRDIIPGTQLMAFGNEAQFLFHTAKQNSMKSLAYRGYNFTCEIWGDTTLENTLYLRSNESGRIYNMNFHYSQPIGLNYTQRVVAQVGYRIHIFWLNITQPSSQLPTSCDGSGIHIRDSYAHEKTLLIWTPCRSVRLDETEGLWSTLHVLHIDSWNLDGSLPLYTLEYDVIKGNVPFEICINCLSFGEQKERKVWLPSLLDDQLGTQQ
ncbi:CUB domain-containing protein [Trichonephila clavipes]|nr:CUB domain-containing protein [Trichonephila clavipes]